MKKLLFMLALFSLPAMAQDRIPHINIVNTLPVGSCTPANTLEQYHGDLYTCDPTSSTWRILGGTGGGPAFGVPVSAPIFVSATSPFTATSLAYCDITAGCAANYTITTDSCPAINHAAAAAQAAGGGVVLLPAVASGYACSTQLNFAGYSNVTLQCQIQSGAGTPCRIFWIRTDSTTMINEIGASNVKIQGIQVLGQSPSFNGYLVDISGTQNASIVDDFFEGYFGGTNTKGICLNCANSGGGGDTQSSDTYIFNTSFASLSDALQMPSAGLTYYSNIVHLAQNKFLGPFAKAALQLGGANIVIDGNNHFESIAASGGIYSATYVSGGTFPTTGPCALSSFNHGSTGAIASIAVSGGTPGAITMYYGGTGATSAPTTATLSGSGCSGTVTLTTVSTPDVHSSVAGAFAATPLGLNGFAFNNNWVADGFTGTIGDFSALTGGLSTAFSFFASGNELDDSTTVFKLSPWMQNVIIQGNFFDNCTNSYDLNGLTATSDDLYTTLILQPTECTNQYIGTPNPAAAGFFYAADGSIAPIALTLPSGTKMTGSVGNGGFAQETTNASKTSGHLAVFDANGNTIDGGAPSVCPAFTQALSSTGPTAGQFAPGDHVAFTPACSGLLATDSLNCKFTSDPHGTTGYDVAANSGNVITLDAEITATPAIVINQSSSALNTLTFAPTAMTLICHVTR